MITVYDRRGEQLGQHIDHILHHRSVSAALTEVKAMWSQKIYGLVNQRCLVLGMDVLHKYAPREKYKKLLSNRDLIAARI